MKKNTLILNDEKAQLKKRAKEIIETCKIEIRDFKQEEQDEITSIRSKIDEINKELKSIESTLTITNKSNNIKSNNMMEFKLIKAINDVANNRNLDETASAVVKQGVEEMRKSGVSYGGQIQIPVTEMRDVTVAVEGEDVVATNIYNILEPLRAKNVLVSAGAKFLTNLQGDVQVPVMNGANVTWEGETTAASDGAPTFDSVKLQPKRLTCYVDISKQFLIQDSASAEAMIRMDLVNAINSKLESTILGNGAGSTTMPKGIFYSSTELTKITDFKGVCDLEAGVEDANVLGECVYVMSNKAKAALRNMAKSTKSTELVYNGGTIDGTTVYNTSNVAGNGVAYGDFSQLAIGQWGAIDLTVDPFTKAADGKVRLVVNAYFDAKVLRADAIKVATV